VCDVWEDRSAPRLGGETAAPEPLGGKLALSCPLEGLIIGFKRNSSIQGTSWQSPDDVPAVNVGKYLGEKRMLRDGTRAMQWNGLRFLRFVNVG
jgi:hypothetical protein